MQAIEENRKDVQRLETAKDGPDYQRRETLDSRSTAMSLILIQSHTGEGIFNRWSPDAST